MEASSKEESTTCVEATSSRRTQAATLNSGRLSAASKGATMVFTMASLILPVLPHATVALGARNPAIGAPQGVSKGVGCAQKAVGAAAVNAGRRGRWVMARRWA